MSQQFEFLIILPDGPDGAQNRAAMTPPHESFVGETQSAWLAGGPIFTSHSPTASAQIKGSWVLIQAATESDAVGLLQRDPFTTGQVWDWDKTQILCVRSGLRVPFVKESVREALERAQG